MVENSSNSQNLKSDTLKDDPSRKVKVSLLDNLMNLAGELVLCRNQLLQGIGSTDMKAIEVSGQRIDLITSELQEAIMKTRMQTIAALFDSFNRIVKNLCGRHGKSVELAIQGKEVELDKAILETIETPLNFLVENCVKNGIQKSEKSQIVLKAFHDAGQVNIVVSHDGSGTLEEIPLNVTSAIEDLGGVLEIDSANGKTDIQIKLPLTLAIIPSQITSVGDEKYAIPQSNLSELIRIPAAQVKEKIEKVGDAEVVRLRGELLPILNLPEILGVEKSYTDIDGTKQAERRDNLSDRRAKKYTAEGKLLSQDSDDAKDVKDREKTDRRYHGASAINIAVVFAGNFKYGLVIDELHDAEEIVVKPVGRHLKKYKTFAGATIMGDGKVALILDILNLAQIADLTNLSEANQLSKTTMEESKETEPTESLIIFKNKETEFFAAPFGSVERIERLPSSSIEVVSNQKVVQYRGGALPLFELSQIINVDPLPEREQQEVIVFKINGKQFGLMVTPPVDTKEAVMAIDKSTLKQKGVLGSMIIDDHTTLLLDINEVAKQFLNDGEV